MKILTIVGARPQFIKAGVVSQAISREPSLNEVIVHTGQHYDPNMSDIFFGQLGLPRPDYALGISQGSHGVMTGRMLAEIEAVIDSEQPDRVLVYGDTNSTLAGALAAAKLRVPVAHVEAGLRSYNMDMPEEINRLLTDQLSDMLFCPTAAAVTNLYKEGFRDRPAAILNVGDVMMDSALLFADRATKPAGIDSRSPFVLATVHRAENTDNRARLTAITDALGELHASGYTVVLPLHPRTRGALRRFDLSLKVCTIEPVGYLEMIWLLQHCDLVLTDSGGVQKEAFFFRKPCVTMRDETEWVELVQAGANQLAGADADRIVGAVRQHFGKEIEEGETLYGDGKAADRIARQLAGTPDPASSYKEPVFETF